ncbi:MAG: hypothetical protein NWR41_04040 [Rickettsiaceae bacterium]|nr:hypothetical protein [Rickettsiaceae bacterium]
MSSVVLKHEKAESISQIKPPSSSQKEGLSSKGDSFRGLIRKKSKQPSSTNNVSNTPRPNKTSTVQKTKDIESEEIKLVEELSVTPESLEIENLHQLGEEHFIKLQLVDFEESEEISFVEEDELFETRETETLEAENVLTFMVSEQPRIPLSSVVDTELQLESLSAAESLMKDSHVVEVIADKETQLIPLATIVAQELDEGLAVQFSKLSPEEQALLQNMKSLELPKGFTLENRVMEFDTPQSPSVLPETGPTLESNHLSVVAKEAKAQIQLNPEFNADDIEVILKQALISNNNIMLADVTRQGQSVLSKMHLGSVKQDTEVVQAFANDSELVVDSEEMSGDSSGNNSFNSKNANSNFVMSGGVIENKSEDFFQMSFKDNVMAGLKGDSMPKPVTQLSLSVIEALNSSATNGKKTIVINLFPQALGPVKVEVLSVAGKDGVRQIESIKFIADKRETLSILEAAKEKFVELTTKATNIKEETSLEFEMNQGERGQKTEYFANAEERNVWMSQFTDLSIEGDDMQSLLENDSDTIGYITEDSVNIKV